MAKLKVRQHVSTATGELDPEDENEGEPVRETPKRRLGEKTLAPLNREVEDSSEDTADRRVALVLAQAAADAVSVRVQIQDSTVPLSELKSLAGNLKPFAVWLTEVGYSAKGDLLHEVDLPTLSDTDTVEHHLIPSVCHCLTLSDTI